MKRLFVFGCSFTNYSWPTWADLLSLEYDYYENWGICGAGNRAIAERVAECHALNTFSKNDTVIVQWSSHIRHDWYKDYFNNEENTIEGWEVHHESPQYIKNRKNFEEIFSEKAYMMHTLNMLVLIQSLLSSTNCKWHMTSLGDIRNLGYDTVFSKKAPSEFDKKVTQSINLLDKESHILWDLFPEFKFYKKLIWKDNSLNWLDSLFRTVKNNKDKIWIFDKDNHVDFHPTPCMHFEWLQHNIDLNNAYNNDRKYVVEKFQQLKDSKNFSSNEFLDVSEIMMEKLGSSKYPTLLKKKIGF